MRGSLNSFSSKKTPLVQKKKNSFSPFMNMKALKNFRLWNILFVAHEFEPIRGVAMKKKILLSFGAILALAAVVSAVIIVKKTDPFVTMYRHDGSIHV
jgi:hypothetical protein